MPIQPSTHKGMLGEGGPGKPSKNAGRNSRYNKNKDGPRKEGEKRRGEREFEVMEQALDPHSVPHPALELVLSCAETDPQVMLHAFTAHTHGLLSADGKQHQGSHYLQGEFIVNNICSRRPSNMCIQNIPLMSSER